MPVRFRRSPVVVPDDGLHGSVRSPQVPKLDEPVLATRGQAEGLVRVVVQVSNRETVRFGHRGCSSTEIRGRRASREEWAWATKREQC